MRIHSHEILVVDVPLERPWMGVAEMRHVILRLRTDDGVEGLGWAGWFDNRLLPALASALEAVAAELVGLEVDQRARTMAKVRRLLDFWGPGMTRYVEAMIDFALHDLAARAAGVSVAELLGSVAPRQGAVQTVAAYASQHLWRDWGLDELESGAAALKAAGWSAMKFRIGANRLAADEAERARVMRAAVGPDIDIMVDVNQGWDVARTKEVAPLLEPHRLAWLEDPIDHRDLSGYRRLVTEVGIPITHGEYHFDHDAIGRIAADRSADVVMIDAHHLGGIDRWCEAAVACDVAHLPVATHLSPEIGVHLAAATPNCRVLEYMDWSVNLFNERLELDANGRIIVPDRPGLGVTLDEDLVRARGVN